MTKDWILMVAAALAAAIHSTHAQIITNGSFEVPDVPTYVLINAGDKTIAPWVVGLHSVEVGDAEGNGFIFGASFDGGQHLDLTGLARGRITQTFATTPGLLYTLTFAYCNNYYEPSGPASATVRVFDSSGDRLKQTVTHRTSVAGDLAWTVFTGQFTTLQSTAKLEFTSLTQSPSGHSGGIMIDAIEIVEAPSLRILSVTRAGNGGVVLIVHGTPKGVHRIQASTDVSAGSFVDVATVTADDRGLFQIEDSQANLSRRFYRVVLP